MWREKPLISLMLEETQSAPRAVAELLQSDPEAYLKLGAVLRTAPPAGIVTIARGSSDHAAAYFAYLMTVHSGRLVTSLPMSLVTLYHAPLAASRLLAIAISQSGRSPDVLEPIRELRKGGAITATMLNDLGSPLAESAEWVLPLHAGLERSVAATKSFICSLVAGARLTAYWCQCDELLQNLKSLPEALEEACSLDWTPAVETLAASDRLMVISRGLSHSIAKEAALKLKETCGIQAEAFSAAEVRHGPQTLIAEGYPLFAFALRGPAQAEILNLATEMRQRGAKVILAAPANVPGRDLTLATTGSEHLDPIAAIQSFYPLAEAVSRARGRDTDRPPYLNKITTTH
jgi:glucosamine--fructose-6-phosphate aminotransferase (isomerizing)